MATQEARDFAKRRDVLSERTASELRIGVDQVIQAAGRMVPRLAERYRAMVSRLDEALRHDPEQRRAALQNVIGESVTLQPDKSGRHL
jgi:hypothetical protein